LREGLDIPECALVVILDADKEGYLRSKTALVQTIGRAARNVNGRVILYADRVTRSMQEALEETERRRSIQNEFNIQHNITPKSILRSHSHSVLSDTETYIDDSKSLQVQIASIEKKMREASENLLFEEAAKYRDKIKELKSKIHQ
ncbi:MAG: UvrB/UvrC motif-containing protein, partial [Holosporales bacterium]|nr:UvrB/UvrC motif-containing protein [Holosporales bacterium]